MPTLEDLQRVDIEEVVSTLEASLLSENADEMCDTFDRIQKIIKELLNFPSDIEELKRALPLLCEYFRALSKLIPGCIQLLCENERKKISSDDSIGLQSARNRNQVTRDVLNTLIHFIQPLNARGDDFDNWIHPIQLLIQENQEKMMAPLVALSRVDGKNIASLSRRRQIHGIFSSHVAPVMLGVFFKNALISCLQPRMCELYDRIDELPGYMIFPIFSLLIHLAQSSQQSAGILRVLLFKYLPPLEGVGHPSFLGVSDNASAEALSLQLLIESQEECIKIMRGMDISFLFSNCSYDREEMETVRSVFINRVTEILCLSEKEEARGVAMELFKKMNGAELDNELILRSLSRYCMLLNRPATTENVKNNILTFYIAVDFSPQYVNETIFVEILKFCIESERELPAQPILEKIIADKMQHGSLLNEWLYDLPDYDMRVTNLLLQFMARPAFKDFDLSDWEGGIPERTKNYLMEVARAHPGKYDSSLSRLGISSDALSSAVSELRI